MPNMLVATNPISRPVGVPNQPTPWHQRAVAWANGTTFFAPLVPPQVRYRHPRTAFVTLGRVH